MDLPAEAQSEDDFLSIELRENLHLLALGALGESPTRGQDYHDHYAYQQRSANLDAHHPSVASGAPLCRTTTA